MAQAFYHRGLTIEYDGDISRLMVDGQEVPLPESAKQNTYSASEVRQETLLEQARQYVDETAEFNSRDSIRDRHLSILKEGAERWNEWRLRNPEIRPLLYEGSLDGVDLAGVNLANANMIRSNLNHANLANANFHEANLGGADLSFATLTKANFCRTDLYESILSHADLESANLQGTQLAKTDFRGAKLSNCRIYGLAAWDLKIDEKTQQNDLVVIYKTPADGEDQQTSEGRVTVDDIRVAQFVYLLLNNNRLRDIIGTIGNKAVLILGRFTQERKAVLDAIREALRHSKYIPILFDFEKPSHRDLQETIVTLAGLSRFIIADISDPKSIPQELV
jgi:hypothetical protein